MSAAEYKKTFLTIVWTILLSLFASHTFAQTLHHVRVNLSDEASAEVHYAVARLTGPATFVANINEGASFIFEVPSGRYTLSIESEGYATYTASLNVNKDISLTDINLQKIGEEAIQSVNVIRQTALQSAREQPYTVHVIDASKYYNSTADLNTLLTRTSGIRVREQGGVGSDFTFNLNGFSGKSVKFYLDRIPMENFGPSLQLNNLPATLAERIEVYKGVVPISLGGDALGGAINIVSRRHRNYLDASYSIGSFNTHKAGVHAAYTHPKTGITLRLNSFYNYSDNNYKVDVQPVDLSSGQRLPMQSVSRFHDQYHSGGANVEVGVQDVSYADDLFLGLLYSANNKDIQTGVTMDEVFGARSSNSHSWIPSIKYGKQNFLINNLDLHVSGVYNATTNQFVDTSLVVYNWLGATAPSTNRAETERTQRINKDHEGLVNSALSYQLNSNNKLAINYLWSDFNRNSSDIEDPNNVTFVMPQGLSKQTLGFGYEFHNEKLDAQAFGKMYHINAESFSNVSTNNQPDYQAISMSNTYTGYGAAVGYRLFSFLQAKASYEHAYRMPDPTEYLGDGLFVRRNELLRPENSDNINFGVVSSFDLPQSQRLQFESGLIYRSTKDYIRMDQARFQPIDRQFINVGDVDTKGIEAQLEYRWRDKVFASVNGTYQDIIDKTEFITTTNLSGTTSSPNLNYGYKIPNIPYFFGNLQLGYTFGESQQKDKRLTITYNLNYVHDYYLTPQQLGSNNQDIIPEQWAHSMSANYALANGKYTLSIDGNNLTNSRLFDNYRLQKPGRSFALKLRYHLH